MTFDDVAAAIDLLAELDDARLDLERVTLVGHSAGGQLALWAAGRAELPAGAPGAAPRVTGVRVLALAAVCDIAHAGRVAVALLGGTPDQVPERWAQADPIRRIPLDVPVALVHGARDETVAIARSREYATAAEAAGADVTLVETGGGHRDPIDPQSAAWHAAAGWLGPGEDSAR
jgi:acetyl esterase/lipase